ncbi:hypothetical protein IFM89_034685 [Coptis chinensis]|uniref:Uncharacterized protein n=1 Tax=Coptis chinensis TaxID=261450 RepID=A0A835HR40_9MAGN|nr:hypothetical protein IFM89_034685 [Coptis chinensis]
MHHFLFMSSSMAEHKTNLHIAVFPWLAFGHILPFFQLSKSLAQRGHYISFISTPRNLQRLPRIPPNLSAFVNLTPLPIPPNSNLPPNAEATSDISPDQTPFLFEALDSLQESLTKFLEQSRPDWLIYDFATSWLPPIAAELGSAIQGCEFMAVRSCIEFESEWLSLLENELYLKPVVAVGLLPPPRIQNSHVEDERWVPIKEWLDKQRERSIVYIAFGSESTLSQTQLTELAHGLELSELPFFWVIRKPTSGDLVEDELSKLLPIGFEDRVEGRGFVTMDWVPQLRILAHPSVGGFLTHSGWSSIIEGLGFGLNLILLPLSPPQALNARLLESKTIGLEIPRDEQDGSFTRDSVAESMIVVMVGEEGEMFRRKVKEMTEIFGDRKLHDRYMDEFDRYLSEYKSKSQG